MEKVYGYISKIEFNNTKAIDTKENDIIVFVGPNNAGKSQALKDIYELCRSEQPSVVVKSIEIHKTTGDIKKYLETISTVHLQNGLSYYSGLDYNIFSGNISNWNQDKYFGATRPVYVAYLNTLNRLTICNPTQNIKRNAVKQHPIHYAAFDKKYRKWLSDSFHEAFGQDLIPNTQFGSEIPLCIGNTINLEKNKHQDTQSYLEDYAEILANYEQVQNQGDGIKSFTGILLYLMLDYHTTYLIDEPESFLHPPQAKIMGQIIGKTLSDQQQAFISTHSEEIIKGLLEVCPERIKIIRITRNEEINDFSILDNINFNDVWNDPLLKYSNIMSSLFHKQVVICESDSDCKMYSIIENHLKQKKSKYSETLFIHCGGKHRLAKIVSALRTLNIDVKVIVDIDILNEENVFQSITESVGIVWDEIARDYRLIVSNLHSPKDKVVRNDVKAIVNRILDSSENRELSSQEIKDINDATCTISKWASLKENGVSAIPRGDAKKAFNQINELLKQKGIFVVPVGELECFIKEVGKHGPEWTNTVLETYPDLDSPIYDSIKSFISNMNL